MTHRSQLEAERMEKLCSLHVIGELSAPEKRELEAHLALCEDCRLVMRDYERITLLDLEAIDADRLQTRVSRDRFLQHPDRLLANLLNQIDAAEPSQTSYSAKLETTHEAGRSRWDWLRSSFLFRPSLGWAAACIAVVTAGGIAIQARHPALPIQPDLSATLDHTRAEAASWKDRAEELDQKQKVSAQQLDLTATQSATIAATLGTLRTSYSQLQQKETLLEQQLVEEQAKLAQQQSELQVTSASLDQERQQVRTLNAELVSATTSADQARSRIAQMMQVSEKIPPVPRPEPLASDAEAREIFGARDLHIVDVYDVDRAGKTRRTYGRVYYVNQRLLLFYAFDLEDRKNNRKAAGFQAWGFREPNSSKPENLGLFYVDDASLNRWVLRVSNPAVLSRIDTVFVTLEPPEGSTSPRGPKLLFASLGGPANHP